MNDQVAVIKKVAAAQVTKTLFNKFKAILMFSNTGNRFL